MFIYYYNLLLSILVAVWSKTLFCSYSIAGIVVSNPAEEIYVVLFRLFCVV